MMSVKVIAILLLVTIIQGQSSPGARRRWQQIARNRISGQSGSAEQSTGLVGGGGVQQPTGFTGYPRYPGWPRNDGRVPAQQRGFCDGCYSCDIWADQGWICYSCIDYNG